MFFCKKGGKMDLISWLTLNRKSALDFAKVIGCSRVTIYKACKGSAVDPRFAKKIFLATGGLVKVKESKQGRPKI